MQSTPFATMIDELSAAERVRMLEQAKVAGLPNLFAILPDPRSRHGQRYPLPFLLTCLVAALLCNCYSMDAVSQWCRDHRALLEQVFGPLRFLSPSGSLFRRLLPRLSAGQIEGAVSAWVIATRPQPDTEPVALDGKTLRRAGGVTDAKPHLLSLATQTSHEVLAQVRVAAKTNEIPVALALLPQLPLQDRVVTADALHGHAAFARTVLDGGADYLIAIKENEPHAFAALQQYFADPAAVTTDASSRDRHHGRIEQRTLRSSGEMNAYLATFPQLAQVLEVTRVVQERAVTCERTDGGLSQVTLDNGEKLSAEVVLVATGRGPRVDGLGLDRVGIQPTKKGIPVDDHCRARKPVESGFSSTSAGDGVWAVGDVTGVAGFTHIADYQGQIVSANILGKARTANYSDIPSVTFTDPEVASVGFSDASKAPKGMDVVTAQVDLSAGARTETYDKGYQGELCLLVDRGDKVLVGAWTVGPPAGEWIQFATLAIRAKVPVSVLDDTILAFPTFTRLYLEPIRKLQKEL